MSEETSQPDPGVVLDLMMAFRQSQTMFAAVSLGVFDALETGPKTLADLAPALKASPDGLERLLDACVNLELLQKSGDAYGNTPASAAYLCQDSPQRVTGYLRFSNDVMWPMWKNLANAVREGTHRWKETYGWDHPIFENFFRTESAKVEFLWGMHGYGVISSPRVAEAFDLSRYQTFVDLGGATGHLVVAACKRYPDLKGIVFDLPEAAPLAEGYLATTDVADRIAVVSGNFFEDPLPPADLYAVGRILHDWNPDKIALLLKRIYDHLPQGGAVLIAEKLLHDDKTGPRWALMQSLNMLLCTEGKERTLGEYEALLHAAGFTDVRGCRTVSPLDAVIARKP